MRYMFKSATISPVLTIEFTSANLVLARKLFAKRKNITLRLMVAIIAVECVIRSSGYHSTLSIVSITENVAAGYLPGVESGNTYR